MRVIGVIKDPESDIKFIETGPVFSDEMAGGLI